MLANRDHSENLRSMKLMASDDSVSQNPAMLHKTPGKTRDRKQLLCPTSQGTGKGLHLASAATS